MASRLSEDEGYGQTGRSGLFPSGGDEQVVRPLKVPWWALPGVGAILFTLGIVSAAQGSLTLAKVSLPHEVQLSANGAQRPASVSLPPSIAQRETVVTPSRPVLTQDEPPGSFGSRSGAAGSTSASGAASLGSAGGSGSGPSISTVPGPETAEPASSEKLGGVPSVTARPPSAVTTTPGPAPPTETEGPPPGSTTTSPWNGHAPGDN